MRRSYASVLLISIAVVIALIALMLGPVPQPVWYGNFADHRAWLGIPNFGDVSSNLPFAVIGVWGLIVLLNRRAKFLDPRERWPYLLVFFGLLLTSIGSGYYHLAPDNARCACQDF